MLPMIIHVKTYLLFLFLWSAAELHISVMVMNSLESGSIERQVRSLSFLSLFLFSLSLHTTSFILIGKISSNWQTEASMCWLVEKSFFVSFLFFFFFLSFLGQLYKSSSVFLHIKYSIGFKYSLIPQKHHFSTSENSPLTLRNPRVAFTFWRLFHMLFLRQI